MFGLIGASLGLFVLVGLLTLICTCREKNRKQNLIKMQKANDSEQSGLKSIIDPGDDLDKDKFIEKLI